MNKQALGTKTVLITGAAGFIGTNLTRRLLSLGKRVIGVDNFYSSSPENIKLFKNDPGYTFIEHDVRKPFRFKHRVEEIYNLACPASIPNYQRDPFFTLETSIFGIRNVLQLAKKNRAKVLHASTSEIYGDPLKHPQREDHWGNVNPIGPRSCYEEGKRVVETFCWESFRQGMDVRMVRIFNTYGPFMDPFDGRVVTNFVTQALNNKGLTVYGHGRQTRSFCFIDDLIGGFLAFMGLGKRYFGPLNLGNPQEITILELVKGVLKLIPESKSKIVHKSLPKDDPTRRKPDISRAKKVLGWKPEVSLEEGLRETVTYLKTFKK